MIKRLVLAALVLVGCQSPQGDKLGFTGPPGGFTNSGANATAIAGTGLLASGGKLNVDPTVEQSRVSGTCANGTSVRTVAQNGTVSCNTLGAGLTNSGSTIITNLVGGACTAGMVVTNVGVDGATTCGNVTNNDYGGKHLEWIEEFVQGGSNGNNWPVTNSGTGASSFITTGSTTRPGIETISMGTTTTGRSFINMNQQMTDFGSGNWTIEITGGISTLSTAGDEYQAIEGFADTNTAVDQVDGCYFLYDRGNIAAAPATGAGNTTNLSKLACVCASNSVRTEYVMNGVIASDGGFTTVDAPVAALTLPNTNIFSAKVVMTLATKAEFYLNYGSGYVKSCEISTHIPSGSARLTGPMIGSIKSAGTTNIASWQMDRVRVAVDLTTARNP